MTRATVLLKRQREADTDHDRRRRIGKGRKRPSSVCIQLMFQRDLVTRICRRYQTSKWFPMNTERNHNRVFGTSDIPHTYCRVTISERKPQLNQPMTAMSWSTGIGFRDAVNVKAQIDRVTSLETCRAEANHDNSNITEVIRCFRQCLGTRGECFDRQVERKRRLRRTAERQTAYSKSLNFENAFKCQISTRAMNEIGRGWRFKASEKLPSWHPRRAKRLDPPSIVINARLKVRKTNTKK